MRHIDPSFLRSCKDLVTRDIGQETAEFEDLNSRRQLEFDSVICILLGRRQRQGLPTDDDFARSFGDDFAIFGILPLSFIERKADNAGGGQRPRSRVHRESARARISDLRARSQSGPYRVRGWHCCHRPPLRTHRAIFTAVGSSLSNALFEGRDTATEAFCEISMSV